MPSAGGDDRDENVPLGGRMSPRCVRPVAPSFHLSIHPTTFTLFYPLAATAQSLGTCSLSVEAKYTTKGIFSLELCIAPQRGWGARQAFTPSLNLFPSPVPLFHYAPHAARRPRRRWTCSRNSSSGKSSTAPNPPPPRMAIPSQVKVKPFTNTHLHRHTA